MNKLVNDIDTKKYGKSYQEHLFRQYELLVDSADKISERRNNANNYYLGINTATLTLIGVVSHVENSLWILPYVYLAGIIFSIIFYLLINSYKQLNSGKFNVIHEIEKKLPLATYSYEWEVLGRGKDKSRYFPFSHIELWIPITLGIVYFILLIYPLLNLGKVSG